MNRRAKWWELYLFAAISLVILFLIPPTDKSSQILWTVVVFVGMWLWLKSNQSHLETTETIISDEPLAEFFDEDRIYMQQNPAQIADENTTEHRTEVA